MKRKYTPPQWAPQWAPQSPETTEEIPVDKFRLHPSNMCSSRDRCFKALNKCRVKQGKRPKTLCPASSPLVSRRIVHDSPCLLFTCGDCDKPYSHIHFTSTCPYGRCACKCSFLCTHSPDAGDPEVDELDAMDKVEVDKQSLMRRLELQFPTLTIGFNCSDCESGNCPTCLSKQEMAAKSYHFHKDGGVKSCAVQIVNASDSVMELDELLVQAQEQYDADVPVPVVPVVPAVELPASPAYVPTSPTYSPAYTSPAYAPCDCMYTCGGVCQKNPYGPSPTSPVYSPTWVCDCMYTCGGECKNNPYGPYTPTCKEEKQEDR